MEKALKTLPADLIEAYKHTVTRIRAAGYHTSVTAIRTLTWIFHAARPLLIDEFLEALCVEERTADAHGESKLVVDDVIRMCQSLVVYEESSGVIRFIHPTVQDFLKSVDFLPAINLAKTCLNYLENNAFLEICSDNESMKTRVKNYKLCLYAATFWGYHVRQAETSLCIQDAVLQLLESENKRNSIIQMATYADRTWGRPWFIEHQTMLHVIATNGLAKICRHWLNENLKYALYVYGC